jgi:hypothetical protein
MTTTAPTETTALSRQATEARAAEPRALAPVPQYATGFEGAASAPFSAEAAAILAAPVAETEVEIREDGIVYLPGVAYRRILTRAFGAGAWALLPRGPARTMGDLVVYHGALYVLGRFVSEAVGECQTRYGMSYASSLEGARTDCLTRCCKDLGMATELWDPAWRESWQAKYADRTWKEPTGNQQKGRWSWKLKTKATNATVLEGRNVGGPKGDGPAVSDGSSPVRSASTGNADAPARNGARATIVSDVAPDDVPVVGDSGEAPGDELIAKLQAQAVALKWRGPRARNWLAKHFGVESATALTKRQAEDAYSLLTAPGIDEKDGKYSALIGQLAAEGRVKL